MTSENADVGADVHANAQDLASAIEALKAGRAVIFPTDTVYGVGVAVRYAQSPAEIYELKQRDSGKPIAWLVGSPHDLDRYGIDVPAEAKKRVADCWPGALTVIVKASSEVPKSYQSGQGTIGLRMPAGELALELVRAVGPLATSSANRAGAPAPRAFADLDPAFARKAAVTLRGGTCATGIASTVLDFSQGSETKLRG